MATLFRLKPGLYFNATACVPELPDSAAVYYYVVLAHLAFWINIIAVLNKLCQPMCNDDTGAIGASTDYCGYPTGACFAIMRKLLYFICWAPFMVSDF